MQYGAKFWDEPDSEIIVLEGVNDEVDLRRTLGWSLTGANTMLFFVREDAESPWADVED